MMQLELAALPPETRERLDRFRALVLQENQRQNLVARATESEFLQRHIVDSLQLIEWLRPGHVVDIGSGAGLPGIVIACVTGDRVDLVEPRTKRAEFLSAAILALGLEAEVQVFRCKAERLAATAVSSIVARAVAPLDALFTITAHLAGPDTRWVLPKGRTARAELAEAEKTWQGRFTLVDSVTDPEAAIVVAERVRRRSG